MAREASIKHFETIKKAYLIHNKQRFLRLDLGDASLKEIISELEKVDDIIQKISFNLEVIDSKSLDMISSMLNELSSIFTSLSKLDTTQFINYSEKNKNDILSVVDKICREWSIFAGYLLSISKDDNEQKALDDLINSYNSEFTNIEKLKTQYELELDDLQNRYKPERQKAELTEQSDVFNKQASTFLNKADKWRYGIIVTSIILMLVIYFIFKEFCFEICCFDKIALTNYDLICKGCNQTILYLEIFKAIVFRLLIISILSYILSFCIRNYNASMHNYTINMHKANSLAAAIRLLERLYSDVAKDEIILQASNAIFTHQPTGYTNKDPENYNGLVEKVVDKMNPIK